jgi:hypothetical protein
MRLSFALLDVVEDRFCFKIVFFEFNASLSGLCLYFCTRGNLIPQYNTYPQYILHNKQESKIKIKSCPVGSQPFS